MSKNGRINADDADDAAADAAVAAGSDWMLALYGRPLSPSDRTLVEIFTAQAVLAVERDRLTREAEQGERLRQADRVRTAVLAALSHDLRTPLVLLPVRRAVSVDEAVHRALIGIPIAGMRDQMPDDLPLLDTDAGLLEWVIASIVANAVRHSPDGATVRLLAGEISDVQGRRVQIRVADNGPGIPEIDREAMFAPFQRLGDVPQGSGVGLRLAVGRGLAEAVDASIDVEDTPGGGLTMIVTVPVAGAAAAGAAAVRVAR